MLTDVRFSCAARTRSLRCERQGGAVLLVALIVLVSLTLGGLTLVRSVGTATIIAGNLAFQQAATLSAEAATQHAVTHIVDLRPPNAPISLLDDNLLLGYCASLANSHTRCPVATAAIDDPGYWDTYWARSADERAGIALPADAVGNTVSYVVQRLCDQTGDPLFAGCIASPERFSASGASGGSGNLPLPMKVQVYYRVTARVAGPRNTISDVQTIVAK